MNTQLRELLIDTWKQEGVAEGRTEGLSEGKQGSLLRILRHRFGHVPEDVVNRVRSIRDAGLLDGLTDAALDVPELDQLLP